MPGRVPQPRGPTEDDLANQDISNALLNHEADSSSSDSDKEAGQKIKSRPKILDLLDVTKVLDLGEQTDSDGEGDEKFIAARLTESNRKSSNIKGRSVKKGGGFQAMGLNSKTLKAITRKGFAVPTPIQRKTIPLVLDGQDVVGMARTGSGKTAAFVIPMIEKLKGHSAKFGARALVMSPSRELALQTLKVVKELGRGTDIKCVLLVGGDSLEDQFGFMSGNPDVIIATPGRFLHLKVEMSLDLSSIRYVVFDEADRLFEMGFAAQLTEILHALPASRQTLLFSATLPKSLVEFARAGLQEPSLVRLDAESKISPDLQSAFFSVKSEEKEGALLHILHDIIRIPVGMTQAAVQKKDEYNNNSKKRKRGENPNPKESPTKYSTIVFAATKHHVDYLATLLRASGFAVSHAYGSLDQTARKAQVQDFRTGMTNILVVTDVAARGIDIPILANVINYDFPAQPKIYVHRVGRTARAGQRGWSYSLVRESDCPYLLDLQLFLGKRLILGRDAAQGVNFASDVVIGSFMRDRLERNCERATRLLGEDDDLNALRSVAAKGEKLYIRTRNSASSESAKRARDIVKANNWMELNPLFNDQVGSQDQAREHMLARISGFRPQETIFELGRRGAGAGEAAEVVKKRRLRIDQRAQRKEEDGGEEILFSPPDTLTNSNTEKTIEATPIEEDALSSASEEALEITFSQPTSKTKNRGPDSWKDSEHFMSYTPKHINAAEVRGYGVHSGSYNTASQNAHSNGTFVEAARSATMDLGGDEGSKGFAAPSQARGMRWDKKARKYVARANDADGSRGPRLIRGESGIKIAASFRSGRFDAWRKAHKVGRMPRTGETEEVGAGGRLASSGKRFLHKQVKAPKEADRYRDDFHVRKKRVDEAREQRVGRFKDGVGKGELKSVDDVRLERKVKERRRDKNARPAKGAPRQSQRGSGRGGRGGRK
ncbi:MAG: ATP-dependent RNA helicase dbp10 [Trizodia sp. TS-e1964]|nr:MAG: ATP-dependent RNA helicase dbp10 [Trizodia sp. TS-e1964]